MNTALRNIALRVSPFTLASVAEGGFETGVEATQSVPYCYDIALGNFPHANEWLSKDMLNMHTTPRVFE